ncbi:g_PROTEIN_RECEP_F2_3 domain-containing protein [Trichonephila inaurata madagascariensis]|uniref:G_PROTEIN_RECEP_F2_3 domain-containing protein n=1 Tax=Trichonephila inaurata madagascariensis TaxID=2747483 RepID=A0A8X6X6K3_9ARAC|nr:g_PROTEIN_RECEP_F2_3 domain-containing protein [Trichonephila inaurata madagascariensis]
MKYEESTNSLVDPLNNQSYEADPEIHGHPAYYTFQSELYARKWIACCRAALDCCSRMLSEIFMEENDTLHCPRTWDGWQCWPDTPAGEEAEGLCQEHVYFMSQPPPCPKYASKRCLSNGSWYANERDSEWTNYSSCSRIQATASVPHHDAQALVHRPAAERPHLHHLQELHHPGATGPPLRQGQHGPRGEWGELDIFLFIHGIVTILEFHSI